MRRTGSYDVRRVPQAVGPSSITSNLKRRPYWDAQEVPCLVANAGLPEEDRGGNQVQHEEENASTKGGAVDVDVRAGGYLASHFAGCDKGSNVCLEGIYLNSGSSEIARVDCTNLRLMVTKWTAVPEIIL
jgi:hypothetical protein